MEIIGNVQYHIGGRGGGGGGGGGGVGGGGGGGGGGGVGAIYSDNIINVLADEGINVNKVK